MLTLLGALLLQTGAPLAVQDDTLRPDQDVQHYHLMLTLPDTGRLVSGATLVRYVIRGGDGPLVLDFAATMTVDSVMGGRTRESQPVAWRRAETDSGLLFVDHWGAVGDTLHVVVHYHGRPRDGLVLQRNVHGDPTVFADNWPNRARHWFPAEDHPSDKATVSFAVDVPVAWRVVANGLMVKRERAKSGREIWHWEERRPIPVHTMVVGAGRMAVTDLGEVAGVRHTVWTFPEDSAFAVDVPFRRAIRMVEQFTKLIGPFPYEKLAHVQSSTRFGGMENSSAIFYNERGYARRRMGEAVVAHEIAHQWFGDAVTQADWHHLWLSEGFASYFGPLFYELIGEDSTFTARMLASRERYFGSSLKARPVIDTTEQTLMRLLNVNNYQKGAWVLHMLRGEVGDSAFFRGIREYYDVYRDSTVLTQGLAQVMTRQAGRPLDWFFEQWLLRPGYPQVDVRWNDDPASGRATISVWQVQPEPWGTFRFRLPMRLELSDGQTRQFSATIEGRATEFEVADLAAPPVALDVDPEATLLLESRVERRP